MLKIGLTGGIGSGKTTLAHFLEKEGAKVYYADQRAKLLMNTDHVLIENIKDLFGDQAYQKGELNRSYISEQIFHHKGLLEKLNKIVHPAVYQDFERWAQQQKSNYVILESAILYESKGDQRCDMVVAVTAPINERVRRVIARDGISAEQVMARINSQADQQEKLSSADIVFECDNFDSAKAKAAELHKMFCSLAKF